MTALAYALVATSYLVGSWSPGLFFAGRHGVDLRGIGSGNIGSTNVTRAMGSKIGWAVLLIDAAKGAWGIGVARLLDLPEASFAWIGFAALVGNIFPVWHRFAGGKGVASGGGIVLAMNPIAGLAYAGTFFLAKKWSARASIGALTAPIVATLSSLAMERSRAELLLFGVLLSTVWVRHRENLRRLWNGTEPRSASKE